MHYTRNSQLIFHLYNIRVC